MAVAHSMIVVGFYLIKNDLKFKDLGADFSIAATANRLLAVQSNG
jgi:hypothetical protein